MATEGRAAFALLLLQNVAPSPSARRSRSSRTARARDQLEKQPQGDRGDREALDTHIGGS